MATPIPNDQMSTPLELLGHVLSGLQISGGTDPHAKYTVALDMSKATRDKVLAPLDVIFSCSICQDTPSNIYSEDDDRLALRQSTDGPGNGFGRIPRLFLTACAHVVCAKHFEGGGVPFHSMEQRPKAPCPYCKIFNAENLTPQDLFALTGPTAAEQDPGIPTTYFETPPGKLKEPEMEAIRFQYVSMLRFGSKMYLQKERAETKAANLDKIVAELRALLDQQNDPAWADRTRKMRLLGSIVGCLQTALQRARGQLEEQGEDVSDIDEALNFQGVRNYRDTSVFEDDSNLDVSNADAMDEHRRTAASTRKIKGDIRLAQGSAADLANLNRVTNMLGNAPSVLESDIHQPGNTQQSRPSKRRRVITPGDGQEETPHDNEGNTERLSSRDAMPPPQLPLRNVIAAPMQEPRQQSWSNGNGTLPNGQQTASPSFWTLHPRPSPRARNGGGSNPPDLTTTRAFNRGLASVYDSTRVYPRAERAVGDLYQDTSMESLHEYPQDGRDAADHIRSFAYDQPRSQRTSLIGTASTRGGNDALDYARDHQSARFSQEINLHEEGLRTPERELYQRNNGASFSSLQPNSNVQSLMQHNHGAGSRNVSSRHFENVSASPFTGRQTNSFSGNLYSTSSNGNSVPTNGNSFSGGNNSVPCFTDLTANAGTYSNGYQGPGSTYGGSMAVRDDNRRHPTNDGELDNNLRHPTPQRPTPRSDSVSPVRRLTLTPSPRTTSASNMRSQAGLLSHVRSSSGTNPLTRTPHSTGSHRQQLGQSFDSSNSSSSDGLTMANCRPAGCARTPRTAREMGFVAPRDLLAPGNPNARVWNGLSFANQPSIVDENVGGRRRAQR